MNTKKFIDWCIEAHAETNHSYAKYIPYRFHLDLVHQAALKFRHIWDHIVFQTGLQVSFEVIECGCYSHDLIADCRQTYNNILKASEYTGEGKMIAEIARACTEDVRGRNRKERMPGYIYEDIRKTPGARFVKICDRIGNAEFGRLMGETGMYKTYQEEQEHFHDELYHNDYDEMWSYLNEVLQIK